MFCTQVEETGSHQSAVLHGAPVQLCPPPTSQQVSRILLQGFLVLVWLWLLYLNSFADRAGDFEQVAARSHSIQQQQLSSWVPAEQQPSGLVANRPGLKGE